MIERSRTLRILLSIFLIGAQGCVTRYRLDVPHETALPNLDGATVAVLPPFAADGAEEAAIVGRRVAEAAYCGPLGSVHFLAPSRTLESIPIGERDFAALRRSMVDLHRSGSPTPRRWGPWLFHGDRVGPVELRSSIDVSMARHLPPETVWTSEALDPASVAGIPADYVLVSIALARFRQVTRVTALLGLLPFFWTQDLQATRPASLFLLYETKSGRRVWEAMVSTSGLVRNGDARYAREVVDSRFMPFLGAAHLLTGEFEVPFTRTLMAQEASRLGRSKVGLASDCAGSTGADG